MRRTALWREWVCSAQGQPLPASFRQVVRQIWETIAPAVWREMIAAGPVLVEGERYQLHEDGDWCFLTPVTRIDSETWREHVWGRYQPGKVFAEQEPPCCAPEEARFFFEEVVDVVAWHPATPGRWARRTGLATQLGQVWPDEPVQVHQTPLAWLQSGCEGVCFLECSPHLIASELMAAERVIAASPAHARELRAICERPFPVPRITA